MTKSSMELDQLLIRMAKSSVALGPLLLLYRPKLRTTKQKYVFMAQLLINDLFVHI